MLNLSEFGLLVEKLEQKSSAEMAEEEAKLKEKELFREHERHKQRIKLEGKRIEQEALKEKQQGEKVLRTPEEIALEEKQIEKEKAELKKQLKKQEMQAKRDQQRHEKESAELKKQLDVQKQATLMERFLKRRKLNDTFDLMLSQGDLAEVSCRSESIVNTTSSLMDHALLMHESLALEDLRRMHIAGWHKGSRFNQTSRWGVRSKPKVNLVQDLKLLGPSPEAVPNKDLTDKKPKSSNEILLDKQLGDSLETVADCNEITLRASCLVRKLLQFDKSNRPAYYGTWRKKSSAVRPRNPFMKDLNLDYEVDSDEEWEEEEPGESLSDCEKDKEDDPLEEDLKDCSDDEMADSFVVPDGYLSENEGVQIDKDSNVTEEESLNAILGQMENEKEEFSTLFQQQKYLSNLTEQALRKCRPLIITNIFHEKSASQNADNLDGTCRLEQICLQALRIRACPGASAIGNAPTDQLPSKDHECHLSEASNSAAINTPPCTAAPAPLISDSDLLEFVRAIQSSPQNVNKLVQSMQLKFSNLSKSQIRSKVREISDFCDNRWQVKKEVLDRLGLSASKNKCSKEKGIAKFFTKRCLPPQFLESSPKQVYEKQEGSHGGDQDHQNVTAE